jgi:prepilin-type N-terminal cleavage/methylation domain-containing protein
MLHFSVLAKPFAKRTTQHLVAKAFSLSELMVSLAIVGVISALTAPMLITNFTQQGMLTTHRQLYNTIGSITKGITDGGQLKAWTDFPALFERGLKYQSVCRDTAGTCYAGALGYANWPATGSLANHYLLPTGALVSVATNLTGNSWLVGVDVNGPALPNTIDAADGINDRIVYTVYNGANALVDTAYAATTLGSNKTWSPGEIFPNAATTALGNNYLRTFNWFMNS